MRADQRESELRLRRPGSRSEPWSRLNALFGAIRRGFAEAAGVWAERRRQRRDLTRLSDYMLRDIGISREDVVHEVEKPFWRK